MTDDERNAYLASLAGHTTDWFDELFRTSISHKHHISLSGGGEKSNYYVSMGFENKNGLLKQNKVDSYHVNSTVGLIASRKVDIDFYTNLSYVNGKEPSQSTDVFKYAFFANPYERPYNDDGSYRGDQTYNMLTSANAQDNYAYPDNGFNLLRELN